MTNLLMRSSGRCSYRKSSAAAVGKQSLCKRRKKGLPSGPIRIRIRPATPRLPPGIRQLEKGECDEKRAKRADVRIARAGVVARARAGADGLRRAGAKCAGTEKGVRGAQGGDRRQAAGEGRQGLYARDRPER